MLEDGVNPDQEPIAHAFKDLFGREVIPKAKADSNKVSVSGFTQFLEILKLVNYKAIIAKHGSDKYCKSFTTWQHLLSMIYAHVAGIDSLRDLVNCMNMLGGEANHLDIKDPATRSTLSYENQKRSYKVFEAIFLALSEEVQKVCVNSSFGQPELEVKIYVDKDDEDLDGAKHAPATKDGLEKTRAMIVAFDSTTIELCQKLFSWAPYRAHKGATKVHLMLRTDINLPVWLTVTDGRIHDKKVMDIYDPVLDLPKGSVAVVDRGYNDYKLFNTWNNAGIRFVSRVKEQARYDVVEDHIVPEEHGRPKQGEEPRSYIMSDQTVELSTKESKNLYPDKLRVVTYWVEEKPGSKRQSRVMRFMTNVFNADAFTIAQAYRSRWQIEAMFKFIKQNLCVKSFLGTSANAVKIQIYTAMIAVLMLRYYQATLNVEWGLSNLLACLRLALHSYRNLTKFLNQGAEKALAQSKKDDINSTAKTICKMSARPPNGLA
jgi:hypothetical protein